MMELRFWLLLVAVVGIVHGDEVLKYAACSYWEIDGPEGLGDVVDGNVRLDRMVTIGQIDCDENEDCDINGDMNCMIVQNSGDDKVYLNAHSYLQYFQGMYKTDGGPPTCRGAQHDCGFFNSFSPVRTEQEPFIQCLMNAQTCGGFMMYLTNLEETGEQCLNRPNDKFCSRTVDSTIREKQDVDRVHPHARFFEFVPSYYYKMARGVDVDESAYIEGECADLDLENEGPMIAQLACDTNENCTAFSIDLENEQFCLLGPDLVEFKGRKSPNVKLFVQTATETELIHKYFGYLQYAKINTRPKNKVLQEFDKNSGYLAVDCESMCDIIPDCEGFTTINSICVNLVGDLRLDTDLDSVIQKGEMLVFHRKRQNSQDSLTQCELGSGPCVEQPTIESTVLAGSIVGSAMALIFVISVSFLYLKRINSETDPEDFAVENETLPKDFRISMFNGTYEPDLDKMPKF